jgi:hypothetical protein
LHLFGARAAEQRLQNLFHLITYRGRIRAAARLSYAHHRADPGHFITSVMGDKHMISDIAKFQYNEYHHHQNRQYQQKLDYSLPAAFSYHHFKTLLVIDVVVSSFCKEKNFPPSPVRRPLLTTPSGFACHPSKGGEL